MASRKNPSLHWRNRNKSDLIDLSNEIEDTTGNNILNLFDPLNHVDEKSNIRRATINYETPATPPNSTRLKSPVPRSHHSATTNRRNVEKPSDKIEPCSTTSNESAASQSSTNSSASSSGKTSNVEAGKINSGVETKQLNRLSLQDDKPKPEIRRRVDLSGHFADGGKLKLARKHQRSSQELALLTKKIKSFRARYKNHDLSSNPGIIYSPTLYGFKNQDMSVKIVIISPLASAPLSFTCCISTTIEHLISQAVCTIFDSLSEDDSMDKFMLKVTGKDEYFSPEKKLADYALVSHCCKFDRDVGLTLIRTSAIRRPFLRTSQDDFRFKSLLCPDDLLSRTAVLKFSDLNYESLSITTITFDREAKRLYNDVTNRASSIQPQKLLQCTKAICSLMMSCESGQLSESKDNLAELCKSYRASGDSLNDEDRYKMIEVIQHAIKRLVQNMKQLLILTSNCLPVDYELEDLIEADRSNKNAFVDTTIDSIKEPVALRVQLVSQLKPEWISKYHQFHLAIALKHGQSLISPIVDTCKVKPETSFFPRLLFEENLTIPVNYSVLPREVRVCMTLVGTELPIISQPNADDSIDSDEPGQLNRTNSSTSIRSTAPIYASSSKEAQVSSSSGSKPTNEIVTRELAVSMTYLFDHDLNLLQGDRLLYMHPIESDQFEDIYIETVVNRTDPILLVELKKFPPEKKIYFPRDIRAASSDAANESYNFEDLAPGAKFVLELIIFKKQSYEELADDEKDLLWQNRFHLRSITEALPKVILSVPDWSVSNLAHIYHLIDTWTPLEAIDAIQLMLPSFPDVHVRQKAIDWISAQEDDELHNYLPQLLQAFNYEKTLDCPLFWLLMTRALENVRIANLMYWQLKLLSRDNLLQERGETLMNCLLWVCGSAFWKSMDKQENMLNQLSRVSGEIKKLRDGKRMKVLHKMLERVQDYLHEEKPAMPWAPSLEVCDLDMKSCSYFPSNKLPLKLAFRSCEESCNRVVKFHTYDTIFKVGDDLRQDMLAIQMIRIMEKLWLREGLDLRMVTFDCLATNDRQGMVEVVKNAETLRKIQQSSGYLAGAFDPKAIDNYLRQWNTSEPEYQTALDKFLHSCAGYTIATYILGICDRHNDNIMVTNSGHLFHIDFGKFLGDAQMMGPIKRDRTPFVLTADMAYVINGGDRPTNKFKTFIELCVMGLNIIRRNRNLFLNLFSLMSSANIHGLNKESVKYVDRMLMPDLSEREAMTKFTRLIEECLNSKATQVNFFIHNLAQLRFKSK